MHNLPMECTLVMKCVTEFGSSEYQYSLQTAMQRAQTHTQTINDEDKRHGHNIPFMDYCTIL